MWSNPERTDAPTIARPRRRHPAWRRAALALALALGASSCKTHHDQWSFSVTRTVYGGDGPGIDFSDSHCSGVDETGAIVFLAILLLPVAVDLVLLPITLTHDVCDQ